MARSTNVQPNLRLCNYTYVEHTVAACKAYLLRCTHTICSSDHKHLLRIHEIERTSLTDLSQVTKCTYLLELRHHPSNYTVLSTSYFLCKLPTQNIWQTTTAFHEGGQTFAPQRKSLPLLLAITTTHMGLHTPTNVHVRTLTGYRDQSIAKRL